MVGKTPIVVPRQYKYNEHVNDHQVKFSKEVEKRLGNIIDVENIDMLGSVIQNFENYDKTKKNTSYNEKFCEALENIVDDMFKGNK